MLHAWCMYVCVYWVVTSLVKTSKGVVHSLGRHSWGVGCVWVFLPEPNLLCFQALNPLCQTPKMAPIDPCTSTHAEAAQLENNTDGNVSCRLSDQYCSVDSFIPTKTEVRELLIRCIKHFGEFACLGGKCIKCVAFISHHRWVWGFRRCLMQWTLLLSNIKRSLLNRRPDRLAVLRL